jgi:hypothetical protein
MFFPKITQLNNNVIFGKIYFCTAVSKLAAYLLQLHACIGDHRARTFKYVWGPGIDAKEWIPPAYVVWRAGTKTLFLLGA